MCSTTEKYSRRLLKKATFSPAQPRRANRRALSPQGAVSEGQAYPLGRTVRRIRSTKFVRAAEW
jgi:hypothetical protein